MNSDNNFDFGSENFDFGADPEVSDESLAEYLEYGAKRGKVDKRILPVAAKRIRGRKAIAATFKPGDPGAKTMTVMSVTFGSGTFSATYTNNNSRDVLLESLEIGASAYVDAAALVKTVKVDTGRNILDGDGGIHVSSFQPDRFNPVKFNLLVPRKSTVTVTGSDAATPTIHTLGWVSRWA